MQGIAHKHARRLSELRLIREPTEAPAAFGTAVSHALLARVGAGELGPTFRLHVAQPVLSFGKQDALAPGFERAVAAAREAGFAPVLRLAGGRAAAFHEGTLALAHATPEASPRDGTRRRFESSAGVLAEAFRRLGVDARVGEVAGEYCPGDWSVNARGEIKLAGIGQRLIARAAHVGGVVVATGTARLREALIPVYDALELDWDPRTAGSVEDEAPDVSPNSVADAIVGVLAERYELLESGLDAETLALAQELQRDHVIGL
jgi:octanoyl-[GcvH]:protein N-octanoyltransferase